MPIDEQKVILNLKNNLEHKPITASDLPGVNRIGLLPDETLHFEYDPITAYGKHPDMIDNTIGTPTKGIRDKALNGLGLGLAGVMTLPLLAYGVEASTVGPYIGKVLANPWVQRGLTGLDIVDTGIQVASGNYLGAAANWIPYNKILGMFGKTWKTTRLLKERAKNLYNRYTAPKTSIKHTPYKGDQHQLAKFRLVNGGFDKLGITPDDIVYVPKTHPMATHVNSSDIIDQFEIDEAINARKFLLKSEPEALRTQVDKIAYYSPADKIYTTPSFGKYGKLNMKTKMITAHEYQHAVDDVVSTKNQPIMSQVYTYLNADDLSPKPRIIIPPGTDSSKIPANVARYFQQNEGTELHARLGQLKNWYGITDPNKPITPEMWNYARRYYVPSMNGYDNNMQQMFRFVTDPKKFLNWINPRVASQAGIVGTAGLSIMNNENDE